MLETSHAAGRTVHLPTQQTVAPHSPVPSARKSLRLSDLKEGETGRILRVSIAEAGCRKRFAELGLAPGMKVTVTGTGDTLMLVLGGSRMGLASRCAEEITVVRV
ncbi:MAG: FeoA family protein [Phycisphaerae bacterium]